jgi:hypothetical protein
MTFLFIFHLVLIFIYLKWLKKRHIDKGYIKHVKTLDNFIEKYTKKNNNK